MRSWRKVSGPPASSWRGLTESPAGSGTVRGIPRSSAAPILAIVGCIFYAQILVLVTMPVATLRAGLGPVTTGVLLALPGASSLLADVPLASLSDSLGRRRFVVLGGLVLTVSTAVLAVASAEPVLWAVGMILTGGAMALLVSPTLAHLTESVAPEELRHVQGLNGSIQAAVSIVAVVVSGFLLAASSSSTAFATAAVCGAAIAVLGLRLGEMPRPRSTTPLLAALRGYRTGLRLVRTPLVALATALAVAYGVLFLVAGNGFLPSFAISLAVSPAVVGILLGMRTAVVMVVSPSFGRVIGRYGLLGPVVSLTLLGAVGLALVPLAQVSVFLLVPAVLLQGLGIAYAAAASNIWIADATPPDARAVAIATSTLGSRLSLLVAAPLFGLAAQIDLRAPFLAAASLLVGLAILMRYLDPARTAGPIEGSPS